MTQEMTTWQSPPDDKPKPMDKEWFEKNFFDIRRNKPQKGQCLAQFRAVADFVDGWVKQNVIDLLRNHKAGAESAMKVMRNMCCCTEVDSIKIPLEMSKDLIGGMTPEQVAEKDYRMVVEYHYWTAPENVPMDDPHWTIISVINTDELDKFMKVTYTTEPVEGESVFEEPTGGFAPSVS